MQFRRLLAAILRAALNALAHEAVRRFIAWIERQDLSDWLSP